MAAFSFRKVDLSSIAREDSPSGRLPSFVRKAGYYVDSECLRIGDIFLTCAFKTSLTGKAISMAQSQGHDPQHSRWTHVSIYVGDGLVCEATAGGVKISEMYDHFKDCWVLVRRRQSISEHERYLTAIKALQRMGKPYNGFEIGRFFKDFLRGWWRRRKPNGMALKEEGAYTCSGMIYEVMLEATMKAPFQGDFFRPSPADFASARQFDNVRLECIRLPKPSL